MWSARKKQPPIRSLIGEGTVVAGEVRFAEGLRIDGEVTGDVVASDDAASMVVVSEKARIRGRVSAGHVIINGEVTGPVHSTVLLELQPKARIVGDIRYQALEMHLGASIDGEVRPLATGDRPSALKLAASNET